MLVNNLFFVGLRIRPTIAAQNLHIYTYTHSLALAVEAAIWVYILTSPFLHNPYLEALWVA